MMMLILHGFTCQALFIPLNALFPFLSVSKFLNISFQGLDLTVEKREPREKRIIRYCKV